MDTRCSWSRFPHDEMDSAELAGAKTNSDGTRRTLGERWFDASPEQTVAVGGCTARRQRIAREAERDVPFHGKEAAWNSIPLRVKLPINRRCGHPPRP